MFRPVFAVAAWLLALVLVHGFFGVGQQQIFRFQIPVAHSSAVAVRDATQQLSHVRSCRCFFRPLVHFDPVEQFPAVGHLQHQKNGGHTVLHQFQHFVQPQHVRVPTVFPQLGHVADFSIDRTSSSHKVDKFAWDSRNRHHFTLHRHVHLGRIVVVVGLRGVPPPNLYAPRQGQLSQIAVVWVFVRRHDVLGGGVHQPPNLIRGQGRSDGFGRSAARRTAAVTTPDRLPAGAAALVVVAVVVVGIPSTHTRGRTSGAMLLPICQIGPVFGIFGGAAVHVHLPRFPLFSDNVALQRTRRQQFETNGVEDL